MRLFYILFISLFIVLNTSCNPILRVTLGKYFYKEDFLPTPISPEYDFYTEVPYEIRDGWTIIKVRLNGGTKEYSFLFDTGASCIIKDSIVKELGLYPIRHKKSTDINGFKANVSLYKVDITIGQLKINNIGVLSKDDFKNLSNNCYQIDGIIGRNVLDQGVFHFDSENKKLIITNSINKIAESKRQTKLKLKSPDWSGDLFIKMEVNDQKGKFQFDTGAAHLLLVRQKKRNEQMQIKRIIGYSGGLYSKKLDTLSFYKIESIKIGKDETDKFNKSVITSRPSSTNILGNRVIEKYLVTLDRKNRRLYLSPRADQMEDEELKIPNLQMRWQADRILVSALTIGSNLQNKGLHIGDTVTFINDIRTDSFKDYCSFESFKDSIILNIKTNDLVLRIRRGAVENKYIVTDYLLYN